MVSVFADLLYQPPLPALLEMARATGPGSGSARPASTRTPSIPYEIAGALAALDAASGGRAYLGLARGTWLGAIGIEQRRPLAHLRDTAAIVRALLSGDDRGYSGAAYRLAPGVRLHGWRPDPGPKAAAAGGRLGAARRRAGRRDRRRDQGGRQREPGGRAADPGPGRGSAARPSDARDQVKVVLGAVTVVDQDGAAARRLARTRWPSTWRSWPNWTPPPNYLPDSPTRSGTWSRGP